MNMCNKSAPEEIARALRLILAPGQVTELRALDAVTTNDRRPHTESGYFDDVDKLAQAASGIAKAKGIYFTPNPVNPALLARAANRIRPAGKEPLTSDHDIVARRWLLIDADPVRPAGISSSDAEHEAAQQRAVAICNALHAEGWPWPIVADSGNGGHLTYRIDLPADDGDLVQRCLESIAARFDDGIVTIDTSVHNPARIWKLYGTMACKGDSTLDRPHRLSKIIKVPDSIEIVRIEKLEALAATAPRPAKPAANSTATYRGNGQFDVAGWIKAHGLDVTGPEPWQGGRRWVFNVCPWNRDHANRSAYIVQFANGAIAAGCHHNACHGRDWHALRDRVEPGWRDSQKATPNDSKPRTRLFAGPTLIRLSDVPPEPIQWLWPGRIALGKLTLIAGDPGLGKSFLALYLAACVSRGFPWPDNPQTFAPLGSVVILSAEDDLADTIRPRLDAADADVTRIVALPMVRYHDSETGDAVDLPFTLERDLPALEAAIKQLPDCRLVVIDPITAYLGRADSHKNADIRGLLAPLSEMAGRYRLAIVAITHLNKTSGVKAVYRATGSLAFVAAARAVWAVTKDKENPPRRLFLPVKNNLGNDETGLAYELRDLGNGTACLAWEPDPVSIAADDALESERDTEQTDREAAKEWLIAALADGPMDATDVLKEAKENGYSAKTIRRAAKDLRVVKRKTGFKGPWQWSLPADDGQPTSEDAQDAHADDVAILGHLGHLRDTTGDDEVVEWTA